MNRTLIPWSPLIQRSLLVLAIVLASAFAIVRSPVRLGLDLRGGASLIVRVKMDNIPPAQRREVVEQTRQILERRINAYGLSESAGSAVRQPGKRTAGAVSRRQRPFPY